MNFLNLILLVLCFAFTGCLLIEAVSWRKPIYLLFAFPPCFGAFYLMNDSELILVFSLLMAG